MTGQRQDKTSKGLRERWTGFRQHPRVRATVRHPLFPLIALTAFCLIVEETYPFSDFPMYSSLSPGSHYFYLTDENDQALPVKGLFGISASEMKKMYHSKLTPMAFERSEQTVNASKPPSSATPTRLSPAINCSTISCPAPKTVNGGAKTPPKSCA